MMWWNRIHAALLSVFCLQHFIRVSYNAARGLSTFILTLMPLLSVQLMSAQSYEFVMNLNEYQSGDRVPDPVFLRACLRDSSEGCTAMCLESESRDASLDDVSTVSPLIFSTDVVREKERGGK